MCVFFPCRHSHLVMILQDRCRNPISHLKTLAQGYRSKAELARFGQFQVLRLLPFALIILWSEGGERERPPARRQSWDHHFSEISPSVRIRTQSAIIPQDTHSDV